MIPGFEKYASINRTILIGIIIGIISGIGAYIFFQGLKYGSLFVSEYLLGYHMPHEGETIQIISQWSPPAAIWLILPIICTGALISGYIVYRFAPEAEGHGTDAAIKAFHKGSKIRWRVPVVKAIASIITISSGGSAGREGPTAQISAGFGSIAADFLNLSERERRIAIATGIGAGIGTIFKAPLGGAILAAEILYRRDFEADAILPAFIASITGYTIFGFFEGYGPVFGETELFWEPSQIPLFIILGVICAAFGIAYIRTFYGTRRIFADFFIKYNLPPYLKPVSGALIIALLVIAMAHISPEAMITGLASLGTGYGFLQIAMYNILPLSVLLILPFTKIITTSLTIGSGGSGGVFAPGLAIGGAAGGAFGLLLNLAFPEIVPLTSVPAFVIVGMIALFGSIANAPIAVMIMVTEMTSDFSILVPAMGAVAISTILTGEDTIFKEQVRTKAESEAHREEYQIEILQEIKASSAMVKPEDLITVHPDDPCNEVYSMMNETKHTGFPVIDNGMLIGIITHRDTYLENGKIPCIKVRERMKENLITISENSTLDSALYLMMKNSIHHILVVDEKNKKELKGFITSTDIMQAYTSRMKENIQVKCHKHK
ncbi:chloride channel protein [Methanoplanus endosymbiosus]|uniref:Chloride channel protein n=1 Tax=Methanoplanus endosymbiosus TaxID=33865 RepID=A0A9E7TJS9_9EURY|nr:chloride channel protein [Methanoplanus endosymbiosus]UUX92040.1 chloride channel protein [Methanoplanus endosymbiosus]